MTRPKRDPVEARTMIPRVLDELGFGGASRGVRIQGCWAAALPPDVVAHAVPGNLRGDTLEVLVDSPGWGQQIQLRGPELLAALEEVLGEDAPRAFFTRVGRGDR